MKTPEEDFDLLTKRWEIACQQIRHESNMIQQRSTRLFSATGFLLAGYTLLASRVFDKTLQPTGASWLPCLMFAIAAIGLLIARALWAEIDTATAAARGVEAWWDACVANVKSHGDISNWFPELQFQSKISKSPGYPLISPQFRMMRRAMYVTWIALALIAIGLFAQSFRTKHEDPSAAFPTPGPEQSGLVSVPVSPDSSPGDQSEINERCEVVPADGRTDELLRYARAPKVPQHGYKAFFEHPGHFLGVFVTTALTLGTFRGIAKLVG